MEEERKMLTREDVADVAAELMVILPQLRKRLMCFDEIKAQEGLPLSHIQVMAILRKNGPMSVSDLSNKFHIARPNITPLVDRLIACGYVSRFQDKRDKRIVNIRLEPAGAAKIAEIHETVIRKFISFSDRLTREDFRHMSMAVATLNDVLENLERG